MSVELKSKKVDPRATDSPKVRKFTSELAILKMGNHNFFQGRDHSFSVRHRSRFPLNFLLERAMSGPGNKPFTHNIFEQKVASANSCPSQRLQDLDCKWLLG
jgi:hypothetical protein